MNDGITYSAITGKPIEAPVRRTDPATSKAAARSVDLNAGHELVLRALRYLKSPAIDEAIYDTIHRNGKSISPSGARTRRQELVDMALVTERGQGRTEAGRASTKWVLTPAGVDKANAIAAGARQGRLSA